MTSAAIPAPLVDVQGDGRWMSIHTRFVNEAKEKEPDVLFTGDSLVANLLRSDIWSSWFEPLHALNFGIGGDQTQHILWRLQNGELETIQPKVVVILCGTNNHDHTAEQVVEGIVAIVETIKDKQPQATILVLTIPPRGQHPNKLRDKISSINISLKDTVEKMGRCQVVNIDPGFVQSDDSISHHDMFDYLHFTNDAYRRAFEPVHELLLQLLETEEEGKASACGAE